MKRSSSRKEIKPHEVNPRSLTLISALMINASREIRDDEWINLIYFLETRFEPYQVHIQEILLDPREIDMLEVRLKYFCRSSYCKFADIWLWYSSYWLDKDKNHIKYKNNKTWRVIVIKRYRLAGIGTIILYCLFIFYC